MTFVQDLLRHSVSAVSQISYFWIFVVLLYFTPSPSLSPFLSKKNFFFSFSFTEGLVQVDSTPDTPFKRDYSKLMFSFVPTLDGPGTRVERQGSWDRL